MQSFLEYSSGFGDPQREFWLGLSTLERATQERNHELLILLTEVDDDVDPKVVSAR